METKCPVAHHPVRCQCAFEPGHSMLHASESTSYYRGMGMIRSNGALYSAPLTWAGCHFISIMLESIDSGKLTGYSVQGGTLSLLNMRYVFRDIAYGPMERQFIILLKGVHHNLSILSCLRRIQRSVLRFLLRKRRQGLFVALAMGLHPRLGGGSPLGCLSTDALYKVWLCC
jgi:hypothetical protein